MASGVRVAPSSTVVEAGLSTPFTFGTIDQFGNSLSAVPAVWSVTTGGGTISVSGVYTAPTAAGMATVTATAAGYGSSSATVTIANDSRAWYQANSSSGTTLTDASGNGRNGTLTTPAGWTTGVSGNALSLTGGRANLPTGIVNGVNDFTIATWFRIDTLSAWSRIFDFGTGTNANMFLTPQANGTDGPLRFAITTSGGANEQRLEGPVLTADTWYHVAITLSGNIGTMYLNGAAVATNTNMTIHPAALGNTNRNWLGDSQYPGDPNFLGRIDDFRIYGIALSAQQVQQLAQPLITKASAAGANPVTTTSTLLSVLATDATAGETALTYTWSTIGTPPAPVSFSANGTNAAKNSTATFTQPGTYGLAVTIVNPVAGLPTTSTINLTVILRPGDYNNSGIVDAGDYVLWRKSVGSSTLINRNSFITGPVGQADYAFWRSRFGVAIPASGDSLVVSEGINSSAGEAAPISQASLQQFAEVAVARVLPFSTTQQLAAAAFESFTPSFNSVSHGGRRATLSKLEQINGHDLLLLAQDVLRTCERANSVFEDRGRADDQPNQCGIGYHFNDALTKSVSADPLAGDDELST
jgi:Concanavalin A-like lectin/glucanases superfamily